MTRSLALAGRAAPPLTRRGLLGLLAATASVTVTGCTVPFSASPRGVFVVDVTGQNLRRVADGSPIIGWGRDGRHLALQYPDGTLQVAAVDGSGTRPYTGGAFVGPGWSPDGTRRAVIDAAANELRIETAAGEVEVSIPLREDFPNLWLVATPVTAIPVWSPSGGRIAFVAWDGNGDALYTVNANGASRTKWTNLTISKNRADRYPWLGQRVATGDAGNPAWSPDGQFLAYAVFPEVRGGQPGIFLSPVTGGWRGRVTDQPPLFGPVWAVDGASLVYSARPDQFINLFQAAADGSGAVNLTGDVPMNARYPAWSPDGRLLAFAGAGDLYLRDPTGAIILVADTGLVTEDPIWSPDGSKIAFRGVPAQPGR